MVTAKGKLELLLQLARIGSAVDLDTRVEAKDEPSRRNV